MGGVFCKVRQTWVGSQHGGCVSMTSDGVSGWRVEMWRTCEQEESGRGRRMEPPAADCVCLHRSFLLRNKFILREDGSTLLKMLLVVFFHPRVLPQCS